ncbi:hypothetical protein NC652_040879 [Populus alba x Populus x berolinensis]|nr:hypothetical protein NC652_040879 [Populus alba x Populus x berolinensis]
MQTRTVEVRNVSDLASEREVREFFSFSGEIEHIHIQRENGQSKTAFVIFKDPKALEIALLLSGATIVDRIVTITPAENYVLNRELQEVRNVENAVSVVPSENFPSNVEGDRWFAVCDLCLCLTMGLFVYKQLWYVSAGTAWLNGAFSKVARAGQVAGTKTREKFNLAVSNLTAKVTSFNSLGEKRLRIIRKNGGKESPIAV